MTNTDVNARSFKDKIFEKAKDKAFDIAISTFVSLFIVAGGGIYLYLSHKVVDLISEDLKKGKDSKIADPLINVIVKDFNNQNLSILGNKIVEAASKTVGDKFNSMVGFTLGERISLNAANPRQSVPVLVPPDHRFWLVYRISTETNSGTTIDGVASQINIDIDGLKMTVFNKLEGRNRDNLLKYDNETHILELTSYLDKRRASGERTALLKPDGSEVDEGKSTPSSKVTKNLFFLGFGIPESGRLRIASGKDKDGSITISYVALIGKSLESVMMDANNE
ncbi:hypothetical protein [Nitrospirillum bahiense]|uniref:Uncharacterized protein n=1 Tax=Nitrospirillum amazonense TaxID=28077 RepID=A0A560G1C3_9PROT|nr:hypothetical protein [Nitrospirillum amazonense]TWB27697.1 hypothetical protein FBZ88_106160 [Nitrospirillum amazonense]